MKMLSHPPFAMLVPEERRDFFLPAMFGSTLLIVAENAVYTLMQRLAPCDYDGGLWNFYERDGQALFLAPTCKPRLRIGSSITEYRGEVSAEAAGIIATLFTFSHLSFHYESQLLVDGYHRLYACLAEHPEAVDIFQAID
ncbi:antirestriction protein [Sphingobium sp.]|uniref:antirestriction protein n=1 Tax=Sphingobium sp. TaxID=1912891 RepID=UPI00257AC7D3|nr:antirestriction protein [Sphingobium sp.]